MPPLPTLLPVSDEQVYPPREDTFLLLKVAKEEMLSGDRVLEVGTGSGWIASHLPSCGFVAATEINPYAARMASLSGVQVIRTDLFSGVCGIFDLILFNPPYLPTYPSERIDDWLEYALDGGPDGRRIIERFISEAPGHLSGKGRILLLISSLTGVAECEDIFTENGLSFDIMAEEKEEDGETLMIYRLRIS